MTEEEKKEFIRLLKIICGLIKKTGSCKLIKFPDDDGIVDHIIRFEHLYSGYYQITHILRSPSAFGRGFSEICVFMPFETRESKMVSFFDYRDNMSEYVMFGRYAKFDTKKLFTQLNKLIVEMI